MSQGRDFHPSMQCDRLTIYCRPSQDAPSAKRCSFEGGIYTFVPTHPKNGGVPWLGDATSIICEYWGQQILWCNQDSDCALCSRCLQEMTAGDVLPCSFLLCASKLCWCFCWLMQ